MANVLVSQAEWARNHGFSRQYVYNLIKLGKIQSVGGKIDPEDADQRLRARSTFVGHTKESTRRSSKPVRPRVEEEFEDEDSEKEDPATGLREDELPRSFLPDALLRARIKREKEAGLLAEIERKKRQGELVDAEAVRSASIARATAEREALLAWPRRVSANMAVDLGVEERLLLQVQQKYIREFLAERSTQPTKTRERESDVA